MAQTLTLCDEYGIVYEAMNILPDDDLKIGFLEALAELEDNECHRTRKFPKTRLHKIKGVNKQFIVLILIKFQAGVFMFSTSMGKFTSRTSLEDKNMRTKT